MKIKLIGLDLDRTTLDNQSKLAPETVKTLTEAKDKGIEVVIATGRTFESLPKDLEKLKKLRYVITSNGASITDLKTHQIIYSNCINPGGVKKVLEILREATVKGKIGDYKVQKEISVETFTGGIAYISKKEYDHMKEYGSTYRDVNYVINTRTPVPDLYELIENNIDKIENISINFESLDEKEIMGKELVKIQSITVTSSFVHNWEIGNEDTSKATALKFLAEKLGINTFEEMLACGDSFNDLAMIKLAKIGVAVANGADELKKEADFVAPTNQELGVATAVKKIAL